MQLTVLGSGTCQLWERRSSPSYFVKTRDQALLLDMGQGALRRLSQAGQAPAALTAALVSHHHLDHMADLLPLLFALNYDPVMSARASITLLASVQFAAVLDGLKCVFGKWLDPPQPRLYRRFLQPGQAAGLGDAQVITAPARHIQTSIAFRIESEGASLVYLGDSAYCSSAVDLAHGADLLIAHLGGSPDDAKPMHLYPQAAGRLANEAGVKTLLLSHLYSTLDIGDAVRQAGSEFSGSIVAAEDLMRLAVRPGRVEMISCP